jgi:hypothetical protein
MRSRVAAVFRPPNRFWKRTEPGRIRELKTSVLRIRRLWSFLLQHRAGLEAPAAFLLATLLMGGVPVEAAGQPSAGNLQLIYVKILKGSIPEYEKIVVSADGSGTYEGRRLSDAPSPRSFRLSSGVTEKLFFLAHEMHNFQDVSLESHKRVADLGLKTFKYVDGNQTYQCQFNYSTNRNAEELENLFEDLGAVERHIAALDYAMKYDHLGLPRVLSLIQIDLANKALLDPQLMTGTLEAVAHNPSYLHIAQVRAREILQQLQRRN